ncbi:hypothetical protein [Thomasclavelia cocleata]|uniref:hypothetical protein n=1 Tax=Thomasclavelia cocleata TaxID=69824 RepID=UPI00256EE383|nr:hypothetical protein [Thomasclavelia cocleata]
MRKVPRKAYMNQKEFEEFIYDLNNSGFEFNPETIPYEQDNLFSEFVDSIEEVLYYLQFHYKIYSKILDFKGNFISGPVYYQGTAITKANLSEYKEKLEKLIEDEYAFIDEKLMSFKSLVGITS